MNANRGNGESRRGPGPEHFRSTDNGSENLDLLVATGHLPVVIEALTFLGVTYVDPPESSGDLGLTRIELTPNAAWPAMPGRANAPGAGDDFVGRIIAAIKQRVSRGRPGAWVPTMGRNRTIGHAMNTDGRPIITNSEVARLPSQRTGEEHPGLPPGPWRTPPHGSLEGQPGYGVRVGVVDTVLRPHPWLEGAPAAPVPFPYAGPDNYRLRAGHSDAMVGVILHQAPGARIDVCGVFGADGLSTSWQMAKAIAALGRAGVDLINLSCAVYTDDAEPPLAIATAIDRLGPHVLVISSAGNYAKEDPVVVQSYSGPVMFDMAAAPAWPAAIDEVIAVGSVAVHDTTWVISEFSPSADWVDVMAPGERVLSLAVDAPGAPPSPSGSFAWWSGTSLSTAAVTGMVAAAMQTGETARVAYNRITAGRPRVQGSGVGPGPILLVQPGPQV